MSASLTRLMTRDEFLAWEEGRETRHEFDGFQPVAMIGGTDRHEAIGGTLRGLLRDRLLGGPCQVRGPALKVEVRGRIRYPDAFVYCSPRDPARTVIDDPVVVFEVVSPSTSRVVRIDKLRDYQACASIVRYVILEQDSIAATVFARRDGIWAAHPLVHGDMLDLPEIGVTLSLADIHADAMLDEPGTEGRTA